MKNTLAGIMQWDNTIDATGRRELLQEAYESSDRLLSLVESQLIIAKLETRHFEPSPEPVELGPALDGVMGVLMHRYQERSAAAVASCRREGSGSGCISAGSSWSDRSAGGSGSPRATATGRRSSSRCPPEFVPDHGILTVLPLSG